MILCTGTGDDIEDWKTWVAEVKADMPPYPAKRFDASVLLVLNRIIAAGTDSMEQAL